MIEVKQLSKMLLMMNPDMPIFDDAQKEKIYYEQERQWVKDLAQES